MIPFVGWGATAGKAAKKVAGVVGDTTEQIAKHTDDIVDAGKRIVKETPISNIGKGIPPQSLSNIETRKWYHNEMYNIPSRIDKSLSLEEQAKQAVKLRNAIRDKARELMNDREAAQKLINDIPNASWDDLVAKYKATGYSGEALWQAIIDASTRSNKKIDSILGL
jgi:ElaB/YqjD/DUF883 family membrane-anchored ribosome-binding protein